MPGKSKATSAIVEQRVQDVLRIRLDGAEFWDVRQYVTAKAAAGEQPWAVAEGDKPLGDRQLWRYIEQADALVAESCKTSRKKLLRNHLAQRRNLYARAVNAGELRTALAILEDLARLQDLYPATKAHHEHSGALRTTLEIVEEIVDATSADAQNDPAACDPGSVPPQ